MLLEKDSIRLFTGKYTKQYIDLIYMKNIILKKILAAK